jgi:hypothetical protein
MEKKVHQYLLSMDEEGKKPAIPKNISDPSSKGRFISFYHFFKISERH